MNSAEWGAQTAAEYVERALEMLEDAASRLRLAAAYMPDEMFRRNPDRAEAKAIEHEVLRLMRRLSRVETEHLERVTP